MYTAFREKIDSQLAILERKAQRLHRVRMRLINRGARASVEGSTRRRSIAARAQTTDARQQGPMASPLPLRF